MGRTAAGGSGARGTFAKAVEGGAKMLGESPALATLIAGKEHGLSEYKDALEDESSMARFPLTDIRLVKKGIVDRFHGSTWLYHGRLHPLPSE